MNQAYRLAAASTVFCLGLVGCTGGSGEGTDAPPSSTNEVASPTSGPVAESGPPSAQETQTKPQSGGPLSPTQSTNVPPRNDPLPAPGPGSKSALEMTPEEAMNAAINGEITMAEYCSRDTFFTSGDTQMCYYYNNPELYPLPSPPPESQDSSWRDSPSRFRFSYYEAYTAWQEGMPYYEAFCLNYSPVTAEGVSQCEGIETGTVDSYTGEYIGP